MPKYNPSKIEKKWQKYWEKEGLHEVRTRQLRSPFLKTGEGRKNFMLLVEFPYPSGNLHMGHWYAFSLPDVYGRYLRMQGYNVMYPMGFDAFGLPAENAAIQHNTHPKVWTKKNIAQMTKQLKSMGAAFDWSRKVETIDPSYYKWTQWIFLQLYKAGLAYRAETKVNWCPKDKTVLANEQVVAGACDRCGTEVVQKDLTQWMFRITDFKDQLIDDIANIDWPEMTKAAQINWIGRSEGALIEFSLNEPNKAIDVFTTRPDTLFGVTYLVVAPEHPLVDSLKGKIENWDEVKKYIDQAARKTELQRISDVKDKTGVEIKGIFATHPLTDEKVPVWVADYVLAHYGTGAVMAVPAHDERDFDFAKKFNLPIKKVILPPALTHIYQNIESKAAGAPTELRIESECYTEEGELINSGQFNGLSSEEARKKIVEALKERGHGNFQRTYRLHDWILSRQRYWGAPIPMINCPQCGYVPVPEEKLPVKLPPLDDYLPTDEGKSPLAKAEKWLQVKCPKCKGPAQRETDTMDTFVDSSWYYLRYADPINDQEFASKDSIKQWLPVPMYVGGAEHNTMHLLYSRFITKALARLGYLEFNEPFAGRRNHGVILDSTGRAKMSKSKGNTVDPDAEVAQYGADSVRMFLAFMGPYDQGGPWDPKGLIGIHRFINRIWNLFSAHAVTVKDDPSEDLAIEINKYIKELGEDIRDMKFNTAVSSLMKLLNVFEEKSHTLGKPDLETYCLLLAPFAPHVAEEIWMNVLDHKESVHLQDWPKYSEEVIAKESVTIVIQVNGRFRDSIQVQRGLSEEEVKKIVLEREKVKEHIGDREIKKFIFVKDKLTNLVV